MNNTEETNQDKEPTLELNVWEVQSVYTCMKAAEALLKQPGTNYMNPDSIEHHLVKMFDDYCLKRLYRKIFGFLNMLEISAAEEELKAHKEKMILKKFETPEQGLNR